MHETLSNIFLLLKLLISCKALILNCLVVLHIILGCLFNCKIVIVISVSIPFENLFSLGNWPLSNTIKSTEDCWLWRIERIRSRIWHLFFNYRVYQLDPLLQLIDHALFIVTRLLFVNWHCWVDIIVWNMISRARMTCSIQDLFQTTSRGAKSVYIEWIWMKYIVPHVCPLVLYCSSVIIARGLASQSLPWLLPLFSRISLKLYRCDPSRVWVDPLNIDFRRHDLSVFSLHLRPLRNITWSSLVQITLIMLLVVVRKKVNQILLWHLIPIALGFIIDYVSLSFSLHDQRWVMKRMVGGLNWKPFNITLALAVLGLSLGPGAKATAWGDNDLRFIIFLKQRVLCDGNLKVIGIVWVRLEICLS